VVLAATQACRRAADGGEFVARLGRELNLDRAVILSGEQEAGLSRRGILSRLKGPSSGALLADIGGGSTEIMDLGPNPSPGLSLEMGATSLTEAFLTHDPPRTQELKALDEAVNRGLAPLDGRKAARLVATAGTATTLASLRLEMEDYQPERIDNFQVGQEELEAQYDRLKGLVLKDRRKVKGLEPERADIILAGMAILRGLLRKLGLGELTVMDAGLLEGILLADREGLI
jgi:exopolyphosphatase/guanosine-5'-triphosphate,3'-diphosphate pyrophosphatase